MKNKKRKKSSKKKNWKLLNLLFGKKSKR